VIIPSQVSAFPMEPLTAPLLVSCRKRLHI